MGSFTATSTLSVLFVIGSIFTAIRSERLKWDAQRDMEGVPAGPRLFLRFVWKPAPCDDKLDTPNEFNICDSKSSCIASNSNPSDIRDFTAHHEGFDFFCWSKYQVRLQVECSAEDFVLRPFSIRMAPAPEDMLPLEGLTVTLQDQSFVIGWNLSGAEQEQNAATHVLIEICQTDNSTACLSPQKVAKSEKTYRGPGLVAGVSYTVEARMLRTEEGIDYPTAPLAMNFNTVTDSHHYPPVSNVTVEVREYLNEATVAISYLKPEAAGFRGAEIWFTDKNGISLERKRTQDIPYVVEGLPVFSNLTLHVKALYEEGSGLIGSEPVDVEFVIRGGEIPRPVMKTLMAIDGHTVLVQWEHPSKDRGEIHYTVSWGRAVEDTVEVEENDDSSAIIRGLESNKTYNFTVTIHVTFQDEILSNASDARLLMMPSANALIPEVKVMNITKLGISLGWDIILPEDPKPCKFLVKVCPVKSKKESECFVYGDLPHDIRMKLSQYQPYEMHNFTVSVACRYYSLEPVTATSETQTVFAAYPPGSVRNLSVEQEKYSRWVNITWKSPEHNESYPLKYKVNIGCDDLQSIPMITKETTVRVKVPARSWYRLLIGVRAVLDLQGESFENEGPVEEKTLDFEAIPPPVAVHGPKLNGNVYEFEVVPKDLVDGVRFTYQVAKENSDFSEEYSGERLVPFRESEPFIAINMKARVCNEDFCSAEYYFNFTTNVGNPSAVQVLNVQVFGLTNIQIEWDPPKELRGPLDGYQVTVIDKEEEHSTTEIVKIRSSVFSSTKEHCMYEVQVEAFNEDLYGGKRKFGRTVNSSVETSGTHPPPPRGLEETKFSNGTGFTWHIPEEGKFKPGQYRVQAIHMGDDISADPNEEVTEFVITSPSLAYQKLKPESYYIIKISSCSDAVEASCGRYSENFEIYTGVGYPSAPEVQLVRKETTSIVIRWLKPEKPAGPISGYEVALIEAARALSDEDWRINAPEKLDDEFGDLTEDTEYTIHLRAYNIDKNDIWLRSPQSTITVSTESCGKVLFWECLFAVFGLGAIAALVYVTYMKHKKALPDDLEIVMGEEPVAMEERVVDESEESVLPRDGRVSGIR